MGCCFGYERINITPKITKASLLKGCALIEVDGVDY